MASGIKLNSQCQEDFKKLKEKTKAKEFNFIAMMINDKKTEIVVEKCGGLETTYDDVYEYLKACGNSCRYVAVDFSFEHKGNPKDKVFLINWAPDTAPMKEKMVHSSSVSAVKAALKLEVYEAHDVEDIAHEEVIKYASRLLRD